LSDLHCKLDEQNNPTLFSVAMESIWLQYSLSYILIHHITVMADVQIASYLSHTTEAFALIL